MAFRLIVISSAFPPFKAPESAHTLFLCERLAERGLDVQLLTTRGNVGTRPLAVGLTIHPLMADWGWLQLPRLARFLQSNKPDAILLIYIDWIYQFHPMVTFAPVLARWFCQSATFLTLIENENGLAGLPPSVRFYNQWINQLARLLARPCGLHDNYGALLRDSAHIIALSERHLEAFETAHPGIRARANVLPVPPIMRMCQEVPIESARAHGREKLGISEQEVLLVYFGGIYPLKDLDSLVIAFGQLPCNTRLLIIGNPYDMAYFDNLRQLSNRSGAAERTFWLGYCEDELASLYLHAADICVLPFKLGVQLNNSSFAVAAAHGLPIITSRGEKLEAPFVDGINVRLYPTNDPDALREAILELINQPATRARLCAGARRLAEQCFSADNVIDSTLRLLGYPVSLTTN